MRAPSLVRGPTLLALAALLAAGPAVANDDTDPVDTGDPIQDTGSDTDFDPSDQTAADLADEEGGADCSSLGGLGSAAGLALALVVVGRRRR